MTDDDKALLDAKLYGMGVLKNGKHVPIDDVYVDQRDDRIEALSAENERLREALENISMRLPDECHMAPDIAFAALGDTK